MGSKYAARWAGYSPKITPTKTDKPNAINIDGAVTIVESPVTYCRPMENNQPPATPIMPPTRQSDSDK